MIRRIGLASALILGLIGATQADVIRNFNLGNWSAGAYSNDQTKAFSHCAATARYNSGIFVVFSIDRSFNWQMGLANPAWRLTPGAPYNVAISIDGSIPVYATATAISREEVALQLADSAQLFNQFRNCYTLEVTSASQTFGFNLQGTAGMLCDS